jgi:large subunit ribosomal protein L21
MEHREEVASRYAIVETGGKQYYMVEGQTVAIEKLEGEAGDSILFDRVLFRKVGHESFEMGRPYVDGAKVKTSIVKQMRGPKLVIFRFKRRQKVRVKKGHRQSITVVRVEAI